MTVRVWHTVGSKEGSVAACFTCLSDEGAMILYASAVLGLETTNKIFAAANAHNDKSPDHDVFVEFTHKWKLDPYQK